MNKIYTEKSSTRIDNVLCGILVSAVCGSTAFAVVTQILGTFTA